MNKIVFFDLETDAEGNRITDIGATRWDDAVLHTPSVPALLHFLEGADFICGHNIIQHDLKALRQAAGETVLSNTAVIDTLYWSPLLFPSRPYHRLVKDDKLQVDELNNPVNDAKKARDLFYDEIAAFQTLPAGLQSIYFSLLHKQAAFAFFFHYLGFINYKSSNEPARLIQDFFHQRICAAAPLSQLAEQAPVSLAYALSLVNATDRYSITPPWVLRQFRAVEKELRLLRGKPCLEGCDYCREAQDPVKALDRYFNYKSFRSYGGEPLQERAAKAAVQGGSLLAVFPTGGGKSITFQVPALMSGEATKSLTVVISPLQSLMKDQVDNLERQGITEAVTINGLLDPIERSKSIERVAEGSAHILYISPESLRSVTVERLLLGRSIARFVIDEAHCFSSWGQDFRVDYLYIGDFIKALQTKKNLTEPIPVSCFTATAKPKVIEDIVRYFEEKLSLRLEIFKAGVSRTNLHYSVYNHDDEEGKYGELRRLLEARPCPTIVYVSRTKRAYKLAQRLTDDGFVAKPYHGKMDKEEKTANQNDFMEGKVDIMVATSAFGMGVDKSDVGMVVHFDISDSLENYMQEAGRAGRNEGINADCYVLFNEEDLNKHFVLLNQTKLHVEEINQVWKAVKELTRIRERASNSALEIARKAGWDENVADIETRVTTAIAALEDAGYLRRGQNNPRVFANSILAKSAAEAAQRINASNKFNPKQKERAIRIIKKLFSSKSKRLATEEAAESRIDHISDHLGIVKEEVIRLVQLMRDEKILADAKDLTAFIKKGEGVNRSLAVVERYVELEKFLLSRMEEGEVPYHLKELNEAAFAQGCRTASPQALKKVLDFWAVKNWLKRRYTDTAHVHAQMALLQPKGELQARMERRHFLARSAAQHLYQKAAEQQPAQAEEVLVEFSVQEVREATVAAAGPLFPQAFSNDDVEDALFYLSRIEAIKIEGGFLVVYNRLTIHRLEKNNLIRYKKSDYEKLELFYQNKVQQIHIVGEYARKMVNDYNEALRFVDDYFKLSYPSFLNKYFKGSRQDEITQTLTPTKFQQLFGTLSPAQLQIIKDNEKDAEGNGRHIVVAAGPGSGKTRVLVHKLASLLLTEDVKHEQLLMLTFSRAAATEFKKRLLALIGNAANFVEIKTFHSFCFDLLGRVGNLLQSDRILPAALAAIRNGEVEASKLARTALVVDEAQDINGHEFELIELLMMRNEALRVILVGDDDQNIYQFRGADSAYMQRLVEKGAAKHELVANYRSRQNIVQLANGWATGLKHRLKHLPIVAEDRTDGDVSITSYATSNLVLPVVQAVLATLLSGTTCVLTRTNEEAVQANGLLQRHGFASRLVQSSEGFQLCHLQELRAFTDSITRRAESPVVGDADWEEAKRTLRQRFAESEKLETALAVVAAFEEANPTKRYKTDWAAFQYESRFEDFVRAGTEAVVVSTIHKAKGKEFDNVFLLLSGLDPSNEDCKRQLYVAVTRAKSRLAIHYNGRYLRHLAANGLVRHHDATPYPPPTSLAFLLTMKDVQLGYFEFVQHRLQGVVSGAPLQISSDGLCTELGLAVKFSAAFSEQKMEWEQKGYRLSKAKVNVVVHWKNPNNGREVKVVLPEVELRKGDGID